MAFCILSVIAIPQAYRHEVPKTKAIQLIVSCAVVLTTPRQEFGVDLHATKYAPFGVSVAISVVLLEPSFIIYLSKAFEKRSFDGVHAG